MYNTMAGTPTISIGELADDGSGQIESTSSGGGGGVAANFAVGSLNTTTNYGGTIIDNVGIIKVGTGGWILSGATLTYSGQTTVSNGTLVLSTNCTLPNSSPVAVYAPGILDVSATSPLILGNGTNVQILQGNGQVNGSVVLDSLGNLSPGTSSSIGTLTITNDLNLGQSGTNLLKLNRTNSPGNSDRVVATTIEAGGMLVVTNTGPNLHTGDKFQLFSTAVTGSFTSITLPVTTANGAITYVWTTNLAVDGSMVVSVGVPTTPTSMDASLSGNQLSLSWPADYQGWYLQAQTNSLGKGLTTTNWVDVPNSSAGTAVTITVAPNSPAVFYRMSLNP
jgi:autotransporter-associated beta strand protein